ncbi:MAG: WecB/TagA/CpsF family glycosyltransferase [bacterium]|nr:WecB/TagA/CpsF family glycosyltransferase [bacterium]
MDILGVRIDSIYGEAVLAQIQAYFDDGKKHHIVTVNPEFVVDSQLNNQFFEVLKKSDMSLVDGIGILIGMLYLNKYTNEGRKKSSKVVNYLRLFKCYWVVMQSGGEVEIDNVKYRKTTGTDLVWMVVQQDFMKYRKIYLIGGVGNVASRAVKRLSVINSHVQFRFSNGHKNVRDMQPVEDEKIIADINQFSPDILLVGYGHPYQDLWIDSIKEKANFKVAIGVGGAFDFISKDVPRAPVWVRKIGMEWAYRLFRDPKRYKRIISATVRYADLLFVK